MSWAGLSSSAGALCEGCALWLRRPRRRCSALQIKALHSHSWGKGGHIAVYPVSEHQCRAKAMLKCSSIVFVSSFVRLTNEVHGDTVWERRSGAAENAAVASRCTGEGLIFAQQLLWQTSDPPHPPNTTTTTVWRKGGNSPLINGSVTDT